MKVHAEVFSYSVLLLRSEVCLFLDVKLSERPHGHCQDDVIKLRRTEAESNPDLLSSGSVFTVQGSVSRQKKRTPQHRVTLQIPEAFYPRVVMSAQIQLWVGGGVCVSLKHL